MADLLLLFSEGKYADFLAKYVAEGSEESRELLTCKGIAHMRTGDVESAKKVFQRLLDSNPDDKEVSIYMAAVGNSLIHNALDVGNQSLHCNDFEGALRAYGMVNVDEYKGLNSDLVYQLLNNRAVCLLNSGRPDEALAVFEHSSMTSCMNDPSEGMKQRRVDVHMNTAIVLKTLGRLEQALDAFEKCLAEDASHANALCGKSEVLNHLGRHDEALETAQSRLDDIQPPVNAGLLVACGFALMKLMRSEEALRYLQRAVDVTASEGAASIAGSEAVRLRGLCRAMQANSLLNSGDAAGALVLFDEVISDTPAGQVSLSTSFNRALALMQLGSAPNTIPADALGYLDAAIAGYTDVVEQDPSHFHGRVGLSQAFLLKADVATAAQWSDAQVSYILQSAVSTLESANALRPHDTQVLQSLASALCRLSDFDKAAIAFRRILVLCPDMDVAQQGLAACEAELLRQSQLATSSRPPPAHSSPEQQKKSGLATANAATAVPAHISKPAAPAVSAAPVAVSATTIAASQSPAAATAPTTGGGDLLSEIRASGSYYSHDSLRAPGPFPSGIDQSKRELYLSEEDFANVMGCTKDDFLKYPQWKQVSKKKSVGLF